MSRWLGLAVVLSCQGCLVPPPPELKDPEQTKPFVISRWVFPSLGEIVQFPLSRNQLPAPQRFTFAVRSEDKGEEVALALHVDLETEDPRYFATRIIPPAQWSDPPRQVTMEWAPQPSDWTYGCHYVTIVLAHLGSFDQATWTVREELRETDMELVSWLVNVYEDEPNGDALHGCPRAKPDEPDTE